VHILAREKWKQGKDEVGREPFARRALVGALAETIYCASWDGETRVSLSGHC